MGTEIYAAFFLRLSVAVVRPVYENDGVGAETGKDGGDIGRCGAAVHGGKGGVYSAVLLWGREVVRRRQRQRLSSDDGAAGFCTGVRI